MPRESRASSTPCPVVRNLERRWNTGSPARSRAMTAERYPPTLVTQQCQQLPKNFFTIFVGRIFTVPIEPAFTNALIG